MVTAKTILKLFPDYVSFSSLSEEIVSKLQADLKNADELMAAMKKGYD